MKLAYRAHLQLQVKNVEYHVGPAIHKHDMPPDNYVGTVRWRRRQPPFKVRRAGLDAFPQTRRKCSAANKLLFQAGRQLIPLGQSGRQSLAMLGVPVAHFFPVAIPIIVVPIFTTVAVIVFVIAVLICVPCRDLFPDLTLNLWPLQTFLPRTRRTIFSIAWSPPIFKANPNSPGLTICDGWHIRHTGSRSLINSCSSQEAAVLHSLGSVRKRSYNLQLRW